jgi:ATP-binding cassette subfamily C protein
MFRDSLTQMSPIRIRTKPAGALVASLQRHPPAVAGLVIGHDAAKTMLGIGPLLVAAAIAALSWQAALAMMAAVPLMIVFFVLLGSGIRGRAESQEKAFGRLAAQFADRIRTLPTILSNHALQNEYGKIQARMIVYSDSTMSVLKLAFLNSGVIDFFSALAIAVLAVLLGLGHLKLLRVSGFYDLSLWQTLSILILSAEFFAPFRRYAEQYHVKAEGQAAAKEMDWLFQKADEAHLGDPGTAAISSPLGARGLTELPSSGLIAVSGPSGSGKSTLLRALAGLETPSSDLQPPSRLTDEGCDWVSTDVYVPAGTLAEAIGWNRGTIDPTSLRHAAARVGLLDERLLPGGLEARIAEGGSNLSGGQRMRIGIARVLLSNRPVLADEPTAKLDERTAQLVRRTLIEVAAGRLVVVATHDRQLITSAFRHHVLRPRTQTPRFEAA